MCTSNSILYCSFVIQILPWTECKEYGAGNYACSLDIERPSPRLPGHHDGGYSESSDHSQRRS